LSKTASKLCKFHRHSNDISSVEKPLGIKHLLDSLHFWPYMASRRTIFSLPILCSAATVPPNLTAFFAKSVYECNRAMGNLKSHAVSSSDIIVPANVDVLVVILANARTETHDPSLREPRLVGPPLAHIPFTMVVRRVGELIDNL
jgi:hypothetical protein